MSTTVFPTLTGLGWDVVRTPVWDTVRKRSMSGKETRIAYTTYPQWEWSLRYEFLRTAAAFEEMQSLVGFFNARRGAFDSFLYTDADDNSVTAQVIGVGDGTTTAFQLVRTFGGFVEPIWAPNSIGSVYLDAVLNEDWTVASWGSATPGMLTFDTAPADGEEITADFTYYWPVTFSEDRLDFSKFMAGLYSAQGVRLRSVK